MIYRPQYAFSRRPAGFEDEAFHYSFDSSNVPVLGTTIAAGANVQNIPLQLQNDAEFILRAVKIQLATAPSNLYATIRDPFGNFVSAVPLPLDNYLTGAGAALIGRMEVPFESEIHCPLGGFFQLFLYNLTTGSVLPPQVTLYGVNRRLCGGKAAA